MGVKYLIRLRLSFCYSSTGLWTCEEGFVTAFDGGIQKAVGFISKS